MILSIPGLIAFISSVFTLDPGDLVFTGTPAGVGEVFPGDVLAASLVGLTALEVTVADDR
jgi:fumarylpyruvate hydrolase